MAADGFTLPHIIVPNISQREAFKTPRLGGSGRFPSRVPNREAHAQALLAQNGAVVAAAREAMEHRQNLVPPPQNGYYLRVESRPAEPMLTDRFEQKRTKVELLAVKEEESTGVTTASLFVPAQAADFLGRALEQYRTQMEPRAREPEPKNRKLVEGIGAVDLGTIRDLWMDPMPRFPAPGEPIQWEAWFRVGTTERFRALASDRGVYVSAHPLLFPEDVALLVEATPEQMAGLVDATVSVSRLARAKRSSEFVASATTEEHLAYIDALLNRTILSPAPSTSVCVLDTGIMREHPLLQDLLRPTDCHSYDPTWGLQDTHGHGTKIGGVCVYGDLLQALLSTGVLEIPYKLESVKMFPPVGQNPHDLLGAITAGSIARAEIASPQAQRVFCLATTTDEDTPHHGRPTSWSAELDQLSSGASEEVPQRRLICVSAGNIRTPLNRAEYLLSNDLAEIEAPAQAWNPITVGACTSMVEVGDHEGYEGWMPFADAGDLSPSSRTAIWNKTWPIKPDVVLEGGNLVVDPADNIGYGAPQVQLVTTSAAFPTMPFECIWETSAATANAARLAGLVRSKYPTLWPETVRALIVDSAEWTDTMLAHLPVPASKTDYAVLLKRYGFGIPNLPRALNSARNSLTLVAEDELQPFSRPLGRTPILNEMKVFPLPWPSETLIDLGAEAVRMRVTLSYFIEPNPAESARNRKNRYASHGLRFAVKLPDEDEVEFRKRINKAARTAGEAQTHTSDTGWVLGPANRDRGSLHSDSWHGPASDLARRGLVAVYPVGGWWKERPQLDRVDRRARFALVVSISTQAADVDIYTPITTKIAIQIQA